VEAALSMERHKNKSNREIAKLCEVSDKFVATIRSPEAKEKQESNRKSSNEKKYSGGQNNDKCDPIAPDGNLTHSDADPRPSMTQDFSPSEEELEANQLSIQADMDLVTKMIESDDVVATLHAEVKRLSDDNASLQSRVNALMREKNTAVELLKSAQRKLDRLYKQGLQTA
jgi:hypothetical protein